MAPRVRKGILPRKPWRQGAHRVIPDTTGAWQTIRQGSGRSGKPPSPPHPGERERVRVRGVLKNHYAHSENRAGARHDLVEHLKAVAWLAAKFADMLEAVRNRHNAKQDFMERQERLGGS